MIQRGASSREIDISDAVVIPLLAFLAASPLVLIQYNRTMQRVTLDARLWVAGSAGH
jgi:hypothetical protein